ncbi:cytochrome d ubiquinol oxidase subunit II, partial [Escherichia coli]|uniref:cytochrome d ubiquinol oxidase subunit II n=1 Tax=Escherichia coli TaxID=562 RepID=UPI00301D88D0
MILRFIWWLLVGVLLIGFAVTDVFDMGVGMLTRFLGRNDTERRIMINSIAPGESGKNRTKTAMIFAGWQHGTSHPIVRCSALPSVCAPPAYLPSSPWHYR